MKKSGHSEAEIEEEVYIHRYQRWMDYWKGKHGLVSEKLMILLKMIKNNKGKKLKKLSQKNTKKSLMCQVKI